MNRVHPSTYASSIIIAISFGLLSSQVYPSSLSSHWEWGVGMVSPRGGEKVSWKPGYGLRLNISMNKIIPWGDWRWGLGYIRFKPDGQDMLNNEGMDFKVTKEEGWLSLGSTWLTYPLWNLNIHQIGQALEIRGGFSLHYSHQSPLTIKGFYPQGATAIGKEINYRRRKLWTGGGSAQVSIPLNAHIKLNGEYHLTGLNTLPQFGYWGLSISW